jgi:hypothetical protein
MRGQSNPDNVRNTSREEIRPKFEEIGDEYRNPKNGTLPENTKRLSQNRSHSCTEIDESQSTLLINRK